MKDLSQDSSRACRVITASPGANQNDYAPTGWTLPSVRRVLRLTPTASVVITGLAALNDGDTVTVLNDSAFLVCLSHENAGSLAANRFDVAEGVKQSHVLLCPGESRELMYIGSTSRFRLVGEAPAYPRIGFNRSALVPGSGTAPQSVGLPFTSQGGTISHPALAATNYRTQLRRWRGATGTTAGTQSGGRIALTTCWRGNAAGLGGFMQRFIWGYSALPATAEASFVGLLSTTAAPGNVDTGALTNMVGWGKDPADTNLRVYSNDGTGVAAEVDLGVNFPINTTAVYEGTIYSDPNGARISLCVWRNDNLSITPDIRDLSADIPASATFLCPHVWICNRAGAADYQIECALVEQIVP